MGREEKGIGWVGGCGKLGEKRLRVTDMLVRIWGGGGGERRKGKVWEEGLRRERSQRMTFDQNLTNSLNQYQYQYHKI